MKFIILIAYAATSISANNRKLDTQVYSEEDLIGEYRCGNNNVEVFKVEARNEREAIKLARVKADYSGWNTDDCFLLAVEENCAFDILGPRLAHDLFGGN